MTPPQWHVRVTEKAVSPPQPSSRRCGRGHPETPQSLSHITEQAIRQCETAHTAKRKCTARHDNKPEHSDCQHIAAYRQNTHTDTEKQKSENRKIFRPFTQAVF